MLEEDEQLAEEIVGHVVLTKNGAAEDQKLLHLAVCCTGLDIVPSSSLVSNAGFFSRMAGVAPKNEKREVRVQVSAAFPCGGRPPSLLYDTIYVSEVIEDLSELKPSLMAHVSYPADKDRKLRINVYYTSSITNGKDVLIGCASFGLREFLRYSSGGYSVDLASEHCSRAKAIVHVVPHLPRQLITPSIGAVSTQRHKNPLLQEYVFYRAGELVPAVHCTEMTSEPRLTVRMPLVFLENMHNILYKTISLWKTRQELERLRQGKFICREEALTHGWRELRVSISSCRLTSRNISVEEVDRASVKRQSSDEPRRVLQALRPSTFIEATVEDREQTYAQPIGKTNTEYFTSLPQYGSNINASVAQKPNKMEWTVAPLSRAWIEKKQLEYVIENPDGGITTKMGSKCTFNIFIPNSADCAVRFDVCLEDTVTGKTHKIGVCWIELGDLNRDILVEDEWIPVTMHNVACEIEPVIVAADLLIGARVRKSLDDEETTEQEILQQFSLSPSLPLCSAPNPIHNSITQRGKSDKVKSRLAFLDDEKPVEDAASAADRASLKLPALPSIAQGIASIDTKQLLTDCYEWMWHLGYLGMDPCCLSLGKETTPYYLDIADGIAPEPLPRLDVKYPTPWIEQHIKKLETLLQTVSSLVQEYRTFVTDGVTFRPSVLKTEAPWQALPINLHFQTIAIKKYDGVDIHSIDSVTCGATAAHGLGYKSGGVRFHDRNLLKMRQKLMSDKETYLSSVGPGKCLPADGPHALGLQAITNAVLSFENLQFEICARRMMVLSQILSISVNSFLMKLELVAEGYIPYFFLERWFTRGFLILFEGLLSVAGKERVMLDDTVGAVDMLKQYSIRILPTPDSEDNMRNNVWYGNNLNTVIGAEDEDWKQKIDCSKVDVSLLGREILLFMPVKALNMYPQEFQSLVMREGALISLFPVLFSQGIDIKQSLSTWDSADDDISNVDLQFQINKHGLAQLTEYCYVVQPISKITDADSRKRSAGGWVEEPHPLTGNLEGTIRNTDAASKNVEMLLEVERICTMLGGCRVTFCKSGKDRTGMAVTLEQSRQLGERFDCGQNIERVIRDADVMRVHGTRIMVAEKNIGRRVYSINRLQCQFLPIYYRPPLAVTEDLIKKGDTS